jgi:hypothetical protein
MTISISRDKCDDINEAFNIRDYFDIHIGQLWLLVMHSETKMTITLLKYIKYAKYQPGKLEY